MEEFSKTFDDIADAWDDFHDDYSTLVKKERRLEAEAGVAGYAQLIEQFSKIVSEIGELTPTDTSEELIETLQDASEIELEKLEYLAESLSEPPDSRSANTPVPTQVVTEGVPEASAGDPDASDGPQEIALSPAEELNAAIERSEAALEAVEKSIEEIVNDKSAENLEDLKGFGVQYRVFVHEWNQFYEGFSNWRATGGGCDRVEAGMRLTEFSRQAGRLTRQVRDLPQSGFLLPVYTLMVEAAQREEGAFRTLASSWTPYAVDVFKAVDEERVASGQLRRQASIALEELRNRP